MSEAISTLNPFGSVTSNGMRMCVCGLKELEVCTMLAYSNISSFHALQGTHTHTLSSHLRTANLLERMHCEACACQTIVIHLQGLC